MSEANLEILETAKTTQKWTTISVFIIVGIFIFDKAIDYTTEKENEKLLAESLVIEANFNLYIIEGFRSIEEQISQNDEIWLNRFSTVVIEEAIRDSKFGNKEVKIIILPDSKHITKIKTLMRDVHGNMFLVNDMLDFVGNRQPLRNQTMESFIETKSFDIKKISKQIDIIEYELTKLNEFLIDSYNVTVENIYKN